MALEVGKMTEESERTGRGFLQTSIHINRADVSATMTQVCQANKSAQDVSMNIK